MGNGTLNSTKCVCVAIFLGSYLGFTVHTECVYSFVLIANIAPAKRSRILFHAIHYYTFVYCKCNLCVSLRLELMLPLRFKLKSRVFSYLLTLFLSISVVLCRSLSHSLHVFIYVCIFFFLSVDEKLHKHITYFPFEIIRKGFPMHSYSTQPYNNNKTSLFSVYAIRGRIKCRYRKFKGTFRFIPKRLFQTVMQTKPSNSFAFLYSSNGHVYLSTLYLSIFRFCVRM